jgi:hypothetical protein
VRANQAILDLADQQDAMSIAETLAGMGYWHEFDRRFWRYDDGFRYQTVRMLLRLNPKEATYQWQDGNMTRSVYREVPPRTIEFLWAIIASTGLVGYGTEIARREVKASEKRSQRIQEERRALFGDEPEVSP